jgi:acyl-CoA synthetase (NDP forming)
VVYPVNPKAAVIRGRRAYPSVRELPEPVDLAAVAVPRDAVLGVVDDCAARGVRALVVISAGFAEVGREEAELQKRLVEKVRGYGMRLIGPNCLGLVSTDPDVRLNATFVPYFPPRGGVAVSSDSGSLGLGGIHIDILGDICFRVTPLTDHDVSEMVRGIRGYRLFQGYRGHPAADVAALEELLLRVSRLVEEVPEITELDLNPVFALPPGQGCRIADARIGLKPAGEAPKT